MERSSVELVYKESFGGATVTKLGKNKADGAVHEKWGYDDGCDVTPHCLECPLAECKYDDPYYYNCWKNGQTPAEPRAPDVPVKQLAQEAGVSARTMYRRLSKKD